MGAASKNKHIRKLRLITPAEEESLSQCLENIFNQRSIKEKDFNERAKVCQDVEEVIKMSGVYGT